MGLSSIFNCSAGRRSTAAEKILLAEREPLAPEVVEAMFAEINLLVMEGDAAGLAAKVDGLGARVRRDRGGDPAANSAGRELATAPVAPVPLVHSADA
jgi:hypothetical protein